MPASCGLLYLWGVIVANIKVLTKDGKGRSAVPAQGTQVMVGDQKLDNVTSISLDAGPSGLWSLTVTVYVDPNALFETLPAVQG